MVVKTPLIALALVALGSMRAFAASPAPAPPSPGRAPVPAYTYEAGPLRAPGAETHDGFFLRATAGVGAISLKNRIDGKALSMSGPAFVLGVSVGGAVARDWIVFG